LTQQLEQSKKELAQLEYEDTLVQLNSFFEQYGCRQVMKDFRDVYPRMFEELVVQIDRLKPGNQQVAALLR
jgi:hypothetical protein